MVTTPYPEQLIIKGQSMKECLNLDFLPDVIPSPIIDHYRNKLRFDIGLNPDGKVKVGYALSKKQSIDRFVYSAHEMVHLSKKMKEIVLAIEEYFEKADRSIWIDWLSLKHAEGNLQSVIIRTSYRTSDSMIYFEKIKEVTELMIEFFQDLCLDSKLILATETTPHVIRGTNYITEKLLKTTNDAITDLTFRISTTSFFQVCTPATDVLYNKIASITKDLIKKNIGATTILFDLCCGTGTIGMYLTDDFDQVIGIEYQASSIADAKVNMGLNSISNMEFICAKIEDVLDQKIKDLKEKHKSVTFFAIIDPPRTGMHGGVQTTINDCEGLDYVVYVSCNILTLKRDLILMPNFEIQDTYFIDLFPHTPHCEVIMVLKRKKLND